MFAIMKLPVPGITSDDALSELQSSLVLLAVLVVAVLLVKAIVGDSIVSAVLGFGGFKVWGAHNQVSYPGGAPSVTIVNPPDGSRFYADLYTSVSGFVGPGEGRSASFVYYRLNGGPWAKAALDGDNWSVASRRYPVGSYHVEAVAYDNTGLESPVVSSTFETLWRPYPDAVYVSDDIPEVMTAGDPYNVHINYSNTGSLEWNDTGGYRLAPTGAMALELVGLDGARVAPSENYTFSTSFIAPLAGEYIISYRMWCSEYGWFGEEFAKQVRVVDSYHDARLVSMDMPEEMTPGESRSVNITMQNTGTAAWFSEGSSGVYLWMVDGASGAAYKFNGSSDRVLMAPGSVVRNGSDYTFQFTIRAPSPGVYYTQYRMFWDGHYAYGQIAGCTIDVKAMPTPTATPGQGPGTKPTLTPTPEPQYNAHGKMVLKF
jgi:hypothetical protein